MSYDNVLDEIVSAEDLKKFEQVYNEEVHKEGGQASTKARFEYAWCLVRSRYEADIKKGIVILEDLFQTGKDETKRDYLYYLAIGNARIRQYNMALQYLRDFLQCEPGNQQVNQLEAIIKKRRDSSAYTGMAITGGVAAIAIAGLAFVLKKAAK